MRAVLNLFTSILDSFPNCFPLMWVLSNSEQIDIKSPLLLIEQHSATLLTNALQYIDNMLEVANMVNRQVQLHISKMAWAVLKILVTCVTYLAFLAHSLKIKSLIVNLPNANREDHPS